MILKLQCASQLEYALAQTSPKEDELSLAIHLNPWSVPANVSQNVLSLLTEGSGGLQCTPLSFNPSSVAVIIIFSISYILSIHFRRRSMRVSFIYLSSIACSRIGRIFPQHRAFIDLARRKWKNHARCCPLHSHIFIYRTSANLTHNHFAQTHTPLVLTLQDATLRFVDILNVFCVAFHVFHHNVLQISPALMTMFSLFSGHLQLITKSSRIQLFYQKNVHKFIERCHFMQNKYPHYAKIVKSFHEKCGYLSITRNVA